MGILDVLRERELSSLQRSIQSSELYADRVRAKAEHVTNMLTGEVDLEGLSPEAFSLRTLYYSCLENYYRGGTFPITTTSKRSTALWARVEKAWRKAECTQEHYMKAQFVWFHKVFGKAPELNQLATPTAIDRAKSYQGEMQFGVVSNNIEHKSSVAELMRQSEKLLQKLMKAQNCSREEFYKRFVITGLYVFPKEFLAADPDYKRACFRGSSE